LLARLENCHAACAVSFSFGGSGGNGVPSARSIAPLAFGGNGGSGVPSAIKVARFPCDGGKGGNGVPSTCSEVPVAVGRNLVEPDEGTINETVIKLKPTANAIFVLRMDGAS
jgi:hypothetical protein